MAPRTKGVGETAKPPRKTNRNKRAGDEKIRKQKKYEIRKQADHRRSESSEEHQTSGKRKGRDQTRPRGSGRKVKWKLRKKAVQNTLIQYMNTSGSGKRKRNQAQADTNGNDQNDSEDGQGMEKPKRTPPRQTEATKRKGIG